MIDQIKIRNFLKSLRKQKGNTQEEIAEVFGVSSRSVSRWENGITLPDLGILVELADYYGVDIKDIIDGERKIDKLENTEKETLLKVADYADTEKAVALNRKAKIIYVCYGIIIALVFAIVILVFYASHRQYNSKGISSLLCISIDENQPLIYIGELNNHSIYTEKLATDALYYTSVDGDNIPLQAAVENELVSLKDWRKKAWNIVKTDDTEILRYENYEIAISDDKCIIRPITE